MGKSSSVANKTMTSKQLNAKSLPRLFLLAMHMLILRRSLGQKLILLTWDGMVRLAVCMIHNGAFYGEHDYPGSSRRRHHGSIHR